MKIKHVQQEDSLSCVIACIAMISNKTYAEIKKYFPHYRNTPETGIGANKRDIVLVKNKIWPIRHTDLNLYKGKIYIVSVPSLNIKAGTHAVVLDCTEESMGIFDPQEGNDKEFYSNESLKSWGDLLEVVNTNELTED